MRRYRWITAGLSAVLAVLIGAVIAVAVHGQSGSSTGPSVVAPRTSGGPFRTASSMPAALAKRPIPQFDLRDARGGRFSSRSLRGRTVVAISVDPRGDTRTAVRRWLTLHQEPANFHYLIGSEHALAPIWKAFYVSPQIPGDPQSSHTAIIWLVSRGARVAALIPAGLPINTRNLAHDFAVLQRQ